MVRLPKMRRTMCWCAFGNGDAMAGRLLSLNAGETVLETWYAGKLSFKTDAVRSLTPINSASQKDVVKGFGKLEDWKVSNGNAKQVKIAGAQMSLFNNVCAGRKLPFPQRSSAGAG